MLDLKCSDFSESVICLMIISYISESDIDLLQDAAFFLTVCQTTFLQILIDFFDGMKTFIRNFTSYVNLISIG